MASFILHLHLSKCNNIFVIDCIQIPHCTSSIFQKRFFEVNVDMFWSKWNPVRGSFFTSKGFPLQSQLNKKQEIIFQDFSIYKWSCFLEKKNVFF